ncbi:MAG: GAF domain-containing protein [Anaerolineales bacterium]|nr:GAF domain-containing protein [Anaerolineales bacterium]
MSEGSPAQKNDSFPDIFRKQNAVMLLIELETGRILDANPAAIKFYGYSLEQFKGMIFAEISPLSGNQLTGRERRVSDGEGGALISPHTLADGQVCMMESHSSPVVVNGETVLFMILQDVTERIYMESELVRLFEAEQRTHQIAEILRAANLALIRELNLDTVLEKLLEYLRQLVPYDSANVMLARDHDRLVISSMRGYEEFTDSAKTQALEFDFRHSAALMAIMNEQRSFLVADTRQFPGWTRDPGTEHVISWMGVPLIAGGSVIGLYSVDKTEPNFFTEQHQNLAEALAGQAAVAIQNARLFAQIQAELAERKFTEKALRESEERYRSLFENMIDGIYRSTPEGKFVEVNPAMVRMFGYSSKQEMLNIDIKKELYFLPEERGSHILDTGQQEIESYRMRRKDGAEIWVEDHGNYIHDENGKIIYHGGMLRDITERKRAEDAARESQSLLRESQVIAGLGSYDLDLTNGLWRSSDVLDQIFGIDEQYIRSVAGWTDLIHPDDRDEMAEYFARDVVEKKNRFDKEYRIVRKSDQAERWVHGMGELEIDEQGVIRKMRGSIQDITERKRAEEALHQRLMELEALYEALSSLRTVQTFSESLSILLDQMLTAIGSDTGAILLYHAASGELRTASARGWFEEIRDFPVKMGEGVAGTVFVSGKPYLTDEFVKDALPHNLVRSKIPPQWGGACIPIQSAADIVGVLFVAVKLPRQITREQMKLLGSLAEIAGATLHRTRLFDETARRAQEFASLYETSNALSAETDLETMLKVIVANAKKLLSGASSGMYLYLPATNELELTKMDTDAYLKVGTRLQMGEGVAGVVAQTRKPLRIDDYSVWEGRSEKYNNYIIRAVLEVPMLYGGELIGVLTVDEIGDSDRKFTEADERLLSLFASQAAGALHSARLRDEALHRLQHLQTLRTIDKAITSSLDLGITLNILLTHVNTQLEVDAASVLLLHKHEQSLKFSAGKGFRTRLIEGAEVHLNDEFAGRSVMERRIIQISDPTQISNNPSFAHFWAEEGFKSYVCVPLISKGEVKGVMEVYLRSKFTPGDEWLDFLETLAGQAAITIDNTQMFDNVQRVNMELAIAYEATIEGWSRALDLRDKETEGHTQRVTELTMILAKAVGIKDSELQHIRRGALLHDIGKMGISDHILLKKGKLTRKEWEIMSTHPGLAYQMLQPIAYLRNALDIPYCHHEKWDGTGYPRGLKGEQIPLVARLFSLADVWDALTSARPYRKAWTKKKALTYIKQQSGKHFDPQLVEIFLRTIKEFNG